MTLKETLNKTLSSQSNGNIIVAFPSSMSITDVCKVAERLSVRNSLENAVLPYLISISGSHLVYGNLKKFEIGIYTDEFLEKCRFVGEKVSIATI